MIVLISFTSSSGKKQQYKVDPFHVEPYVLSDAKEGLARKSNINFDSLKYEKVVGLQIQKIYSKNKDDIDVITGGVNFYDQWKNNKPLQFDYVTRIENSNVKVT
jgi:hypothetical protein